MRPQYRGILLDRDGTLVYPRHYPSQPADLVLYAGLGAALYQLQVVGFRLVVITNQGGLAHGFFTSLQLDQMHAHLQAELARDGVMIDGIYYCPHHPDGVVPALSVACSCRKPQPGLLLQAAQELNLDLAQSWFIGDILDDVEAGNRAGCRTILVDVGTESEPPTAIRTPTFVARTTVAALALIAAVEGFGPAAEQAYRPARWGQSAVEEVYGGR